MAELADKECIPFGGEERELTASEVAQFLPQVPVGKALSGASLLTAWLE